MALKNLVTKTKEPLKSKAAGEDFVFVELSPKQERQIEKDAKAYFEKNKDRLAVNEDEFVIQYRTFKQLELAGETISMEDFLDIGSLYIGEITMAITETMKSLHPEYFKALKDMERENSAKYVEMLEALKKKQE